MFDLCNGDIVFPVRYELDPYILFRIILECRELRTTEQVPLLQYNLHQSQRDYNI
jgi:hypothetical protein